LVVFHTLFIILVSHIEIAQPSAGTTETIQHLVDGSGTVTSPNTVKFTFVQLHSQPQMACADIFVIFRLVFLRRFGLVSCISLLNFALYYLGLVVQLLLPSLVVDKLCFFFWVLVGLKGVFG
jgi:hypothetical protein